MADARAQSAGWLVSVPFGILDMVWPDPPLTAAIKSPASQMLAVTASPSQV